LFWGGFGKSPSGKARAVRQAYRDSRKQACPELVEGRDEAQRSIWTFYEAVNLKERGGTHYGKSNQETFQIQKKHEKGARFSDAGHGIRMSTMPRAQASPPCLPELRHLQGQGNRPD